MDPIEALCSSLNGLCGNFILSGSNSGGTGGGSLQWVPGYNGTVAVSCDWALKIQNGLIVDVVRNKTAVMGGPSDGCQGDA
jgi:hypothetical protein